MGILQTPPKPQQPSTTTRKRASVDFAKLKPLDVKGTKNFAGYRDSKTTSVRAPKRTGKTAEDEDLMDSDADDEDGETHQREQDEPEIKGEGGRLLSPEDALRQGELAEGVRKIKVRWKIANLESVYVLSCICFKAQETAFSGCGSSLFTAATVTYDDFDAATNARIE